MRGIYCMKKYILNLACLLMFLSPLSAQAIASTQGHEGSVNCLLAIESATSSDASFYSAGNDGFLIRWDSDGMGEHYQVSNLQIRLIAKNPSRAEIALYETDGISVHRVIVIDSNTYARKYTKRFAASITNISYSTKGTYLFVGTASATGTYILNSATGNVLRRASDVSGIVSFAATGASEQTAILYSRSGVIYYYSMTRLRVRESFPTVNSLDQVLLFGTDNFQNRFIAGEKDDSIYIVDATSGRTLCQISAASPYIFASNFAPGEKQGLYYISATGRNYSLFCISFSELKQTLTDSSYTVTPATVKTFTGLANRDAFTFAAKNSSTVMLGSRSGNIYTMPDTRESGTLTLAPVTQNMYQKIYDIECDGSLFYILTRDAVFTTSYDTAEMSRICSSRGHTNITKSSDSLILWSRGTQDNVECISLNAGDGSIVPLFTPPSQIRALRCYKNKIIYILGNTTVSIYDLATSSSSVAYSGTSVQDALLSDDNTLIVAKTTTGSGDSPLVSVNINTGETLPLQFTGDVAFSLSYDETRENALIYGVLLEDINDNYRTRVFSFNPETFAQSTLLTLQSDNAEAFTKVYSRYVFTNIGMSQVRSYNINTRRVIAYTRSASIPLDAAASDTALAVLNYDGSLSWYTPAFRTHHADWYLTTDGEWFEL